MNAKEFYIQREIDKNPDYEDLIKDHAEEMEGIFKLMEEYYEYKNNKEVFVLLSDGDGTLRSIDTPFGVAVSSEGEAKRYIEEGGVGYTDSYEKLRIFDDKDEAIKWAFDK